MKYTIFLSIEPYLAQWLIHESGGEYPIKLKRGSAEADILEFFLQPQPKQEGYIPQFRAEEGAGGNSPALLQKEGYSHVQLSAGERCCSTQGLHTQQIPRHAVEGPLHHRESDKENGYRHQRMDEAAWDCR